MKEYRKILIGIFAAWTLGAIYWYIFIHEKLNFANHSEIIDNNILEILTIISVSFVLGYLLHKSICESKHDLTQSVKKVESGTKSAKDDLKKVEGIGPAIEKILNAENIHTFRDLADAGVDRLKTITAKAGAVYQNHGEETWGEQATLLRDGKTAEFEKLTKELVGGKRVG
jgi:predicted flap endonuclease-1-like 5' DNA nuclease